MSRTANLSLHVAAALMLAACSAGGLPSPQAPENPPATEGTTGAATAPGPVATPGDGPDEPVATPRPTEVPGPPAAILGGGTAGSVAGELGTFFWNGLGSDAPWIVPSVAVTAEPGETLGVTLDPPITLEGWTAAWAPIRDGAAGSPAETPGGSSAPVTVTVPAQPGPWALRVEVRGPGGQRAAWYWLVDAGP